MIGIFSQDKILKGALKDYDIFDFSVDSSFPSLDGLIIDWITTINFKKPSREFAFQGVLVKHYSKKNVPIVIYDRHMSMNRKEYEWLKKFNNIHLFEPALNNRREFEYLPHWIDTENISIENSDRSIDIGYSGSKDVPSFNKYCLDYVKKYNTKLTSYDNSNIEWENVRFTIAIGNDNDYKVGYLNSNIVDAINSGCMPLCPIEHRYYVSMFYEYVVRSIDDINYFVSFEGEIRNAFIISLMKNLHDEFHIDYAVKRIMRYI